MPALHCQHCGAPVTFAEPIPRDAVCESCQRDLRACRNCRHHNPAYNNACTEPMADPVEDKARRNFCEFFYFNRAAFVAAASNEGRATDARTKLDALFGGTSKPADTRSAREKLDGLFGGGEQPRDKAAEARDKLDGLFKKKDGAPEGP
jgi:hypothetical protein